MWRYWRTLQQLVRLGLRHAPLQGAALLLLAVAGGLMPLATMLLAGGLVQSVAESSRSGGLHDVLTGVALIGGVFVLGRTLGPLRSVLATSFGSRLHYALSAQVMESLAAPLGIAHLESPETAGALLRAQEALSGTFIPTRLASALCEIISTRVQGLGCVVILASWRWWAGILLLVAWSPIPPWLWRSAGTQVRAMETGTDELQRAEYFRELALQPDAAKESRVFGLNSFISQRMADHWLTGMAAVWKARGGRTWQLVPIHIGLAAAYVIVLPSIGRAGLAGSLSVGTVAILLQAAVGTQEVGRTMAWWARSMIAGVAARDLIRMHEFLPSGRETTPAGSSAVDRPKAMIRFEDVSFTYPGSGQPVFDGLNLTIPAGKSLAIVGVNGAGKTTLIKLLARLYEPDAGRILIDDIPLEDIDPVGWRSRLGVIFQDFVRFELSARDNVGFGALDHRDIDSALDAAADRAGARELIESLPGKWETPLSKAFSDGVDLSGGQWQRIALARAFMAVHAGARVLVLDEPTANLDVRSEAALFDRFLDLTHGLTTILVSHRFSSVRHADRICVIDRGHVIENGSHDELLASDGHYARLFRLQASRFVDTEPSQTDA